jgi:hypothetical protein
VFVPSTPSHFLDGVAEVLVDCNTSDHGFDNSGDRLQMECPS